MRHCERKRSSPGGGTVLDCFVASLLAKTKRGHTMAQQAKKPRKRRPYKTHFTPEEETKRREAAFAAIKRLYAEVLPVARACPRGCCRRHNRCFGDLGPCLKRVWALTPPQAQERAYNQVKSGGPHRLPPATSLERHLRRYPATNFVH
jgi:hypothetical protein